MDCRQLLIFLSLAASLPGTIATMGCGSAKPSPQPADRSAPDESNVSSAATIGQPRPVSETPELPRRLPELTPPQRLPQVEHKAELKPVKLPVPIRAASTKVADRHVEPAKESSGPVASVLRRNQVEVPKVPDVPPAIQLDPNARVESSDVASIAADENKKIDDPKPRSAEKTQETTNPPIVQQSIPSTIGIDSRDLPTTSLAVAPQPLNSPAEENLQPMVVALTPVSQQADELTRQGFALAERGATFAARKSFRQSLLIIARAMDAYHRSDHYTTSLANGWRALREAEDFAATGARHDAEISLQTIIDRHRTPALANCDPETLTPVFAAQRYYTYAQEQFAAACGQVPVASVALYGIGKLESELVKDPTKNGQLHCSQAMVFHQAAMLIDSRNHLAANELGVLLARAGAWPQARQVLVHSISQNPSAAAWHNLAVVHETLGESELASRARQEWQHAMAQQSPAPEAGASGSVQWKSPSDFAGQPATAPGRTANRLAEPAAQDGGWWQFWK